ncbi:phosphopantothenate--cysteine ligase [Trifolium repens]|nr:phosphopantothenate--cysteine ligase [Trifolium repens]
MSLSEVRMDYSEAITSAIVNHHTAVAGGHLLKLPFNTIFEYLQMLLIIGISMRCIRQLQCFILLLQYPTIMFLGRIWYRYDMLVLNSIKFSMPYDFNLG